MTDKLAKLIDAIARLGFDRIIDILERAGLKEASYELKEHDSRAEHIRKITNEVAVCVLARGDEAVYRDLIHSFQPETETTELASPSITTCPLVGLDRAMKDGLIRKLKELLEKGNSEPPSSTSPSPGPMPDPA